ncbi:hypothetical protein CNEO3_670002 [Clostridium neonatale]|uniref:hypothetical protein n=1 Tax=Clostridium neonatale TaxID=137838 RepID=UPI00291BDC11|nr:hypothetical protein CNEO3_670002 [Clostridium neonatale]CAI3733489.1 hypothetical protein CNEO3_660002 [Clostridium neonatale]
MDKFYRKRKADWEKDKLEYVELSYEDFVKNDTYHLEIDISENTVIQNISELKDTLNNYRMSGKIKSILFDKYSN